MSALVDILLSFIQRIFVGTYASLLDNLQGILPDGILSQLSGNVTIFGFAIPAFLVYAFLLGD